MMNYRLTLLSPVHIGSGQTLTPLDFALVNGNFAVMNVRKILHAAPQRAEEFAAQVARQATRFALTDFLTGEERQNAEFCRYTSALRAANDAVLREELGKGLAVDVAETVKTPLEYQVYIPGSSLKGAFRTAFAYTSFRQDNRLFQALKDRLEHVDWRYADDAVDELIFGGADPKPQRDLFRAVMVSDSSGVPATPATLAIGMLKILSLYEVQKQERPRQGTMFKQLEAIRQTLSAHERSPLKPGWTFLEILPAGSAFHGSMAVDEQRLQHAFARKISGWNAECQQALSCDALIKAANTFASAICAWELEFFETQVHGIDVTPIVAFYRNLHTRIQHADSRQCFLCVGSGAGWHKLSIGLLIEQAPDFPFKKLRKDLRLAPHRLQFAYPKSRKLLMASAEEIDAPLGWIRLECV